MLGSTLTVNEACRGEGATKFSGKGSVKRISRVLLVTRVTGEGGESIFYLAQNFGFGYK